MTSTLGLPRIYLLDSVDADTRRRLAEQVASSLTHDAAKADVLVGKVSKRERAKFELRRLGIVAVDERAPRATRATGDAGPAAKRPRLSGPSDAIVISSSSEGEDDGDCDSDGTARPQRVAINVVKLAWLEDCVARSEVVPLDDFVVYAGRKVDNDDTRRTQPAGETAASRAEGILRRARNDQPVLCRTMAATTPVPPPPLARTSSSKDTDDGSGARPIPAYLHSAYSCQRPTPLHAPNERFVDELKKIRAARQLTGDCIGIRAYSTAIATIAAYPYVLERPSDIGRLPGCGPKIEELFREFQHSADGHVREAAAADDNGDNDAHGNDHDEASAKLAVLRVFCNILGVADATARAFYNKGWRDLDDVVEFGWADLTRVQQIGVKYYDELQQLISRAEVEAIADRVLEYANAIRPGFHMLIAGGYRRGKELSGDVDILLSHRDENATHHLIGRLVLALEQVGLITHTLVLSTANSERGQEAVSWKGSMVGGGGSVGRTGFDTLDKALVVWQDPMPADAGTGPNTNPHRRVDIIVSPWRTVGCAVLGWSGGTTFQRDLRRYCKHERGLKFDSSGARRTSDGAWVDLEDYACDPAPDMLTAERRVFDALELEYWPPSERCTG